MEQAQVVGKECNQTYAQVTYDLAVDKIAYKIQSTSKPQFNNLFIHLGSFQWLPMVDGFLQSYMNFFINECGLSHMMVESNIILHPLMALGLQMLHFDHFLKMDNIEYNFLKEHVIDDLLHYQKL
ncbi:uncharacterized protein TNCV_2046611 [Trichonephila clavipes]|uniref:Uncharacterized protein n=1 Tax=Trichonephila clavipes TaxID=2585209 RepID=A0A8X6SVP5_TRICX|nr:uncharacterized protein TNCV_2046611 [Trichonephila clavipes]